MTSPARRPTKWIVIGAGAVLFAASACCCAGLALLAWKGRSMREDETARLSALSGVCQGRGAASAAEFVPGPSARGQAYDEHGMVLLYWMPMEHRSSATEDTSAVVCEEPVERVTVSHCNYETGIVTGLTGGHNVIERYAYHQVARVVAAKTGVEIARRDFEGSAPEACPDEQHFARGGETQHLYGSVPAEDDIKSWAVSVLTNGGK